MLSFFPDPYQDELLYSTLARLHNYNGNSNFRKTLSKVFISDSVIPSVEFPCRLDALAKNLQNPSYNAEYFIQNHTMLPFYSPFLPSDRCAAIMQSMIQGTGSGIYTAVGYVAGSLCKTSGLKYCPHCARVELDTIGEPYFHRVHQLQGIFVCPIHSCLLKEYRINKRDTSRIGFIRLDGESLDLTDEYESDNVLLEKLNSIAKAADFLRHGAHEYDIARTYKNYVSCLKSKGLITMGNQVKQKKLCAEFKEFWGNELLQKLDSPLNEHSTYCWLQSITRKPRKVIHPIRHILLILFLTGSTEEFFNGNDEVSGPFGAGPWPCLNPVSEHYKNSVVTNISISADYKTRKPVGTFSCYCGFIYSRKGPDSSYKDKFKVGRIKQFGWVWEDRLAGLIKEGISGVRDLARRMSCDPKTVIQYASKLKLMNRINSGWQPVYISTSVSIADMSKKEEYKKQVLEFICDNPTVSRQMVRMQLYKQYAFLYRHDRYWLYVNLPSHSPAINKKTQRVDWQKRDVEFAEELSLLSKDIMNAYPPVRVTKTLLGWKTGKTHLLEKYIHKLPITAELLPRLIESSQDFRVRINRH